MRHFLLALFLASLANAEVIKQQGGQAASSLPSGVSCANGSSISFDSGTLYVDCTNNRVGAATASPITPFHAVGASTLDGQVTVLTGSSVTVNGLFGVGVSTVIVKDARLGVGTASPITTLHVSGASTLDGQVTVLTGSSVTLNGMFNVGVSTIVVRDARLGILTATPQLPLDVNGAAAMRGTVTFLSSATIAVGNNLGVNINSAATPLSVSGITTISGGPDGADATRVGHIKLGDPADATRYVGFWRGGSNALTAGEFININAYGGLNIMASANTFGSGTRRMTIDATTGATSIENSSMSIVGSGGDLLVGDDLDVTGESVLRGQVTATSSMTVTGTNGFMVLPPAAQTIAAGNTIAADACGGAKLINAGGAVTTDTTNTFTAPARANQGCCMDVINIDTVDTITLDANANFNTAAGADVTLTPCDTVRVCSDGTDWFQVTATAVNTCN